MFLVMWAGLSSYQQIKYVLIAPNVVWYLYTFGLQKFLCERFLVMVNSERKFGVFVIILVLFILTLSYLNNSRAWYIAFKHFYCWRLQVSMHISLGFVLLGWLSHWLTSNFLCFFSISMIITTHLIMFNSFMFW